MILRDALFHAKGILGNFQEPEILLSFLLGKDRSYFLAHAEEVIDDSFFHKFIDLVSERKKGRPIQYLTHHVEFFGLPLYVDERCFIPRPETELLVEKALEQAKFFSPPNSKFQIPNSILDLGTGSGAIAIALAKSLPQARITAVDISEDALEVAKINAQNHQLSNIEFLESDLWENISERNFDIVVTNPPYIGTEEFSFVEDGVKDHEPHRALFGGSDGLEIYQKLFQQILELWKKRGSSASPRCVIGEFGFQQREKLTLLLNKFFVQDAAKIEFFKDLAGIDRAFLVQFN